MTPRTRVRLPGLTDEETDLAHEIEDLQRVCTDTDWFLRHCIARKCIELHDMYTRRVTEQHERYATYQRSRHERNA